MKELPLDSLPHRRGGVSQMIRDGRSEAMSSPQAWAMLVPDAAILQLQHPWLTLYLASVTENLRLGTA